MKLYQKLKDQDLVDDFKDFRELVRLRAIKIDGKIIDDLDYDLLETDKNIQVGILSLK